MLVSHRVSFLSPGTIETPCDACGTIINHSESHLFGSVSQEQPKPIDRNLKLTYTILGVACSQACAVAADFYEKTQEEENKMNPEVVDADVKTNAVVETVTESVSAPKVKRFCTECSGPAIGRGFSHKDGCTLAKPAPGKDPNKEVRKCEACGGPAKGRGFTHNAGCSVVSERQAKLQNGAANTSV